jgi:hypothetical protein
MRGMYGLALVLVIVFPAFSAMADSHPCVLEDNGGGTVDLPPDERPNPRFLPKRPGSGE